MPANDTIERPRLTQPWEIAGRIPSGAVATVAISTEAPINSMVAGSRSATRSNTGRPSLKLNPHSPVRKPPSHCTY